MNNESLYIHGIGTSSALDTSGEVVRLEGIDVSSLIGAPFTWEHNNTTPSTIVGKILEIKKIFSKDDCDNEHHKYFWDKIKLPFLYVMGRLFNDKKPSAKEVAALFEDDAEHPNEIDMVGFSVEGSKLFSSNGVVERSIARKITITNLPCNKTCIAEILPLSQDKEDDISSLFKGEVQLFSFEPSYIELLEKKEAGHPIPTSQNETNEKFNKPSMEKGLKGDWQKEGYTLHHTKAANGTHHVEAKDKNGNHVGATELHPTYDAESKTNFLHPGQTYTEDAHQRKGIASAMYRLGESKSGLKVRPSSKQTQDGSKFNPQIHKKEDLEKDVGSGNGAFIGSQLAMSEDLRDIKTKIANAKEEIKTPGWTSKAGSLSRQIPESERPKPNAFVFNKAEETKSKTIPSHGWSKPNTKATGLDAGVHFNHPKLGTLSITKHPQSGQYHVSHNKEVKGKFGTPAETAKFANTYMNGSGKAMPKSEELNKALSAGSGMAAPGMLVGGAALSSESLEKPKKVKALSKKESSHWFKQADEAYNSWSDREDFKEYMRKKMPHLADGEIAAIGRLLALKKTRDKEGLLSRMFSNHYEKDVEKAETGVISGKITECKGKELISWELTEIVLTDKPSDKRLKPIKEIK